jgi:hypothetical protein
MPIWNRDLLPENFTGLHPHLPALETSETGGGGAADTDVDDLDTGGSESTATSTDTANAAKEEDWKGRARTWEQRAKQDARELAKAKRELEEVRRSQMSESEKAVEAARAEGEKTGRSAATGLLVQARLEAALAHVDDEARDALIDGVNTARFTTEDGTPDTTAIRTWAEKVAPKRNGSVDLGQGRRPASKPTDMNSLIRNAVQR